jgi:hypothetical protein
MLRFAWCAAPIRHKGLSRWRSWLFLTLLPRWRLGLALIPLSFLFSLFLYGAFTGSLSFPVHYIRAMTVTRCPTFAGTGGPFAYDAALSEPVVDDHDGCMRVCAITASGPSRTACSQRVCGVYRVSYGGRSGNSLIQAVVGRYFARQRHFALIAPPIDGFGELPAAWQADCPAGFDDWPLSWLMPWNVQVRALAYLRGVMHSLQL